MRQRLYQYARILLFISLAINIVFLILEFVGGDTRYWSEQDIIPGTGLDKDNLTLASLPALLLSSIVVLATKKPSQITKRAAISGFVLLMVYTVLFIFWLLVLLPIGLWMWGGH